MEGLDGRTQYLCHAGTGAPEYSGLQSWVPKEQVAEVVAEPVLDLCIFPEPRGRGQERCCHTLTRPLTRQRFHHSQGESFVKGFSKFLVSRKLPSDAKLRSLGSLPAVERWDMTTPAGSRYYLMTHRAFCG